MTIQELNNQINLYIDTNNQDSIKGTFITNNGNQNFNNSKIIPSMKNCLLLKNKYEVLEVSKNFKGSLESLIKLKNKKIPSTIPVLNILMIGGGSSGGWNRVNNEHFLSASIGGEIKFAQIYNIDLKDNINITIGKGGESKSSQQSNLYDTSDSEKDISYGSNPGGDTIIEIIKKDVLTEKLTAFGGQFEKEEITDSTNNLSKIVYTPFSDNMLYSKYYELFKEVGEYHHNPTILDKNDSQFLFETDTPNSAYKHLKDFLIDKIQKQKFIFNTNNHNLINYGGLCLDIYNQLYYQASNNKTYYKNQIYMSNNYSSYESRQLKDFISELKNNFEKIPTKYDTINDYGAYLGKTGSSHIHKLLFFKGYNGVRYGEPGMPGDFYNISRGDKYHFWHVGQSGAGADGACLIYYSSEV